MGPLLQLAAHHRKVSIEMHFSEPPGASWSRGVCLRGVEVSPHCRAAPAISCYALILDCNQRCSSLAPPAKDSLKLESVRLESWFATSAALAHLVINKITVGELCLSWKASCRGVLEAVSQQPARLCPFIVNMRASIRNIILAGLYNLGWA